MALLRILLAANGDDPRVLYRDALASLGATVEQVGDGPTAMERILAEEDGDEPYGLVFLDLDLSAQGADGLALARTLRKRGFAGPIVALTSATSEAEEEECLRVGIDDYLPKPLAVDAFVRALRRHVRPPPRKSGVVLRILVSELSGDPELQELLRPWVRGLPARGAAIRSALDLGDLATVKHLAHQLKGSAGSYGFPSITAAATAVDRSVLAGDNPGKIRARVEELTRLISIARASVPPQSTRSEASAVERGREQEARRALGG
jgi:CheY-like chemotaxis protein/HPt (histidine-containing phosphotransfer) domain-containing protein